MRHKRLFHVRTPHLAHGRNENFPNSDALRQRKGKELGFAINDETLLAQYKQSCIKIRELSSCNNFRLDYLRGASIKLTSRLMSYDLNDLNILRLYNVIKMKTFIN